MNQRILTVVSAAVDPSREAELLAGFRGLLTVPVPDGLMRTELLRSPTEVWRIQTLWRDRDALDKMRAATEPPAAPRLFRSVGADPSLEIFEVMVEHAFDE
jgi:heme-degrading monooxygenase HmoA